MTVDPESVPWPQWMLRYTGANNQQAMMDLVWSVGGSPPYGSVSYEEGAAVYELLESHMGPGAASPAAFAAVRSLVGVRQEAVAALDAFECYDAIVTSPENISGALADRGVAIAESVGHEGARAGFLALAGQARLQDGDVAGAAQLFQDALSIFAAVAADDSVYEDRLAATAQNSISLAANAGDVATARYLFGEVGDLVAEPGRSALRTALGM